jgi:ADP-ribosyl-[dinitrogen reductase] hydrolase
MRTRSQYRGAMLGLAVGDAVGTAVEFKPPGSFLPLEDMVGGGTFRLKPGEWTDDTSMALCLAESVVQCKGFDPVDQLERYLRWWREGYMSSNGRCFDIGGTVSAALRRFNLFAAYELPPGDCPWCAESAGSLAYTAREPP